MCKVYVRVFERQCVNINALRACTVCEVYVRACARKCVHINTFRVCTGTRACSRLINPPALVFTGGENIAFRLTLTQKVVSVPPTVGTIDPDREADTLSTPTCSCVHIRACVLSIVLRVTSRRTRKPSQRKNKSTCPGKSPVGKLRGIVIEPLHIAGVKSVAIFCGS
jgi:hypothetical protein